MAEKPEAKVREQILLEGLNVQNGNRDENAAVHSFYTKCIPIIKKVAANYLTLDTINDMEDFLQQGYLAVLDTFRQYRHQDQTDLKITSYLVWQLQKVFADLCPPKDRIVVVNYPDGMAAIISYQKFQKIKRNLPDKAKYTVISRMSSMNEILVAKSIFATAE